MTCINFTVYYMLLVKIADDITVTLITHNSLFYELLHNSKFKESIYWCEITNVPLMHVVCNVQNAKLFQHFIYWQVTSLPPNNIFNANSSMLQHIIKNNLQTQTVLTYTHGAKKFVMLPCYHDVGMYIQPTDSLNPYKERVINTHLASLNFHSINNVLLSFITAGEQNGPSLTGCKAVNSVLQSIHDTHLYNLTTGDRNWVLTRVIENLKAQNAYEKDILRHDQVLELQKLCFEHDVK